MIFIGKIVILWYNFVKKEIKCVLFLYLNRIFGGFERGIFESFYCQGKKGF